MKAVWAALAMGVTFAVAAPATDARAEVEEVECGALDSVAVARLDQYDEVLCMAGQFGGLVGGQFGGNVGGRIEVILAYNRATFTIVRFDGSNFRSFMELPSVRAHIEGILPDLEPRNWGEERRYDRFSLADVDAKIADESPYLHCVGFLVRMRPAAGAPGYREALGGIYCAMDTLTPTEAELTAFLDGLEF